MSYRLLIGSLMALIALVAVACASGGVETAAQAPQQPASAAAPAPAAPAPDPAAPAMADSMSAATAAQPAMGDGMMMDKPKYGGTLYMAVRADPRGGFEAHTPGGRREARQAIGAVYERVAAWDSVPGDPCSQVLVPWGAESWAYTDPTTIDIKLRQGVMFHDRPPVNGRELVADDVVFSFKRMFERGLQVRTGEAISSIEAPDKYTVRIKTHEPFPLLPSVFFGRYEAVFMAPEAEHSEDGYAGSDSMIGTGAFVHTQYTPGVGHKAVRNPDYWNEGLPYIDAFEQPIMRDRNVRIAALEVGRLDYVEEVSKSFKDRLEKTAPSIQSIPCVNANPHTIVMRNDIPPFNDVRLRRAISMGVDRDAFVKGLFKGEGAILGTTAPFIEGALTPEDFPPETRKYLEYNPTAAKALLAEAGFPDGLDVEIFVGLHYGSPFNEQIEGLPGMLRQIGVNATLKVASLAEYSEGVATWGYGPIGIIRSGVTSGPIIEFALGSYHSGEAPGTNRAAVKDPEYDALVEQMQAAIDPQVRLDLARQLQIRFVDNAYIVVLPAPLDFNSFSGRVKGRLRTNKETFSRQTGLMFSEVWLDEK